MGFFGELSGTAQLAIIIGIILLVAAAFSTYSYLNLKAQQDLATEQAELDAKLDEAKIDGYLLSGQNVIVAINNQFYSQGFVSLPIKGQDGNYVQVRFYTEQQCAAQCASECSAELERIMQGAG